MCRFLVYKGSDELLLSKLILDPTHSILRQSWDSRLRLDTTRGQNNADGFGIGFYTDPKLGHGPCLFTSTIPAWNCTNLQRIASKTASRLIFAHVRATTEGSLTEDNCHPFTYGSLMWMHNGGIAGWKHVKRRLAERLADKWYLSVAGSTDSEWTFALFLDTLERMGYDPSLHKERGSFSPTVLRKAMIKTVAVCNELVDQIPESIIRGEDIDTRSLLNFAVTDGETIICTRYIRSLIDEAASLYYSSGTQWHSRTPTSRDQNYQMERQDKGADVVLVASEPLTFERENWVNVPTNSVLTIHGQTVMVHPIVDRYYNPSPHHYRSSDFVLTKGFVANEKTTARDVAAYIRGSDPHKPSLAPTIPFGISVSRSRTPEQPASFIRPRMPPMSSRHDASSASARSAVWTMPTPPPIAEDAPSPPAVQPVQPAQVNIKKKRRSLNELELSEMLPDEGDVLMPRDTGSRSSSGRTEYGNPNKIAQYFPELRTH